MASNFDEMIDRRNTASLKWDVEENDCRCGWRTWILRPHRVFWKQ